MKDLIFITAYCPTEEQEKSLERCVDVVLKSGMDVAIISHSHIPIHIQKKCQYYFYDHLNDISDDLNLLGYQSFYFQGGVIQSRYFNKYFYGFAIYRMFCIASQIAINFGYENMHHIEYDLELIDSNIFHQNSEYLRDYDSVIYTDTGDETGFLFGPLKSFKVKTLPDNFKNYNRDFLDSKMRVIEPKQLEFLTKELFINSGRVLFQNHPTDKYKLGPNFYVRNLHYTLFYNPTDSTLNLFWNSIVNKEEEIVVVVNKEKVFNFKINPYFWYFSPIGKFDEITHVRIDNSEKILCQKSFDNELREVFKNKSYITFDEKNN
jgi:hypothetical protein